MLSSTAGKVIALIIVVVIGLAFGLGDVTGLRSSALGGGSTGGDTLAKVGSQSISAAETKADVERTMDIYRQQYPQLTMEEFVTKGGFDQPLDDKINQLALEEFGHDQGIRVGRALADSDLTTNPRFKGLDGKFDSEAYKAFLAQSRISDSQLHQEISRQVMARLLVGPMVPPSLGKVLAPVTIATPYASMLLEKRTGTIAFIDTRKIPAGAPVTDAEAADYYKRNIARYTVPERRIMRYAAVTLDALKAKSAPTDAEVAAAYKAQAAQFAPSETRSLRQVVLLDQKSAEALAATVRGGTTIEAAAKAVGLDAGLLADQTKAGYAGQTSPAIADQVFAAAQGATIGPVKTPLGWAVVHVEKITKNPGKTLDQAKPDLVKQLTEQKTQIAASNMRSQISDAISNSATLDEIAKNLGLTLQSSAPLDAQGVDPDAKTPPAQPDPLNASLSELGFQSEVGDDPQVAPVGRDGSFVLAKLDKVVPAAPRPIAAVMDQVKKDFLVDRQVKQARAAAVAVVDKVNKGVPLSKALAETGLKLDATKPMAANRGQLVASRQPPPPLVLLFSMSQGTAKMLQAPYKGGWFVIVEDSIERGDARSKPDLVAKMRGDLGATAGDEYAQQFLRAVRNQVGVKRNEAAISTLRASLLGQNQGDATGGQ
jgi:peptidyl-prolyl cis-trans isomerase D